LWCALGELDRGVQVLGCLVGSGFHLLDDFGDADDRRQRGVVSRIEVDAGGAGLDPGVPRHAAGGRLSSLEPTPGEQGSIPGERSGSGIDPPAFRRERLEKTVNCIDYRPSTDDRERILQAPGVPRLRLLARCLPAVRWYAPTLASQRQPRHRPRAGCLFRGACMTAGPKPPHRNRSGRNTTADIWPLTPRQSPTAK